MERKLGRNRKLWRFGERPHQNDPGMERFFAQDTNDEALWREVTRVEETCASRRFEGTKDYASFRGENFIAAEFIQ
jgi:hypothetical protein